MIGAVASALGVPSIAALHGGLQSTGALPLVPGFADSLDALLPRKKAELPTGAAVSFSRHAQARMESRGILLDADDRTDLEAAVDRLAARGAQESLVLLGDHAFIVGVPDRRVVTALTRQEAAGHIFTQIDSTLVLR